MEPNLIGWAIANVFALKTNLHVGALYEWNTGEKHILWFGRPYRRYRLEEYHEDHRPSDAELERIRAAARRDRNVRPDPEATLARSGSISIMHIDSQPPSSSRCAALQTAESLSIDNVTDS